ncbi:MAG: hypothetical protein COX40_06065 [Candidatus Omnitrophica bacterium CG23_combo_of_CG06-09_8_20_14_all_40_11]|nr:MAG: hypothetical protein COX40_06065 [Candidatus Omnitrophica bacterium CG23_combo_of_CG06-09_8_20_14_all_40_11]
MYINSINIVEYNLKIEIVKYFLEIKLTIAPANKNTGIKQARICKAMYSFKAKNPPKINSLIIICLRW